jgi:hypothetical protein
MTTPGKVSAITDVTFEDKLLHFLVRRGRRIPIPIFRLAAVTWQFDGCRSHSRLLGVDPFS